MTTFVATKLNYSAPAFLAKVEAILTIGDLEQRHLGKIDFRFAEFDHAFNHVAVRVDKIKQVTGR